MVMLGMCVNKQVMEDQELCVVLPLRITSLDPAVSVVIIIDPWSNVSQMCVLVGLMYALVYVYCKHRYHSYIAMCGTWVIFHNKIHPIISSCPRPSLALKSRFVG